MTVKDKFLNNLDNTPQTTQIEPTPKSKFTTNLNNEVLSRTMGYSPVGGITPVGNTSIGKSQFDINIPEAEIDNLGLIRATRQPWTHQLSNALAGGIAGGLLTAVEDVGYILDLPNNIKSSIYLDLLGNRIEDVESNALSNWAKENKEALYEALPIYRKEPSKVFDWSDSGFYYEMLKGATESAVGFGLVGMGAGAVVKGLGSGVRAMSRIGDVNKYKAFADLMGKSIQQGRFGNASAAYITNFGESKLMALELYDEAKEDATQRLIDQYTNIYGVAPEGKDLEKIQLTGADIAGKEANTFMLRNKMFMLTDYLQLSSIFRTQTLTRDLLSKPGFKTWAKTQLATAPKEALEEIGQNIFQMEGQYQAQQQLKDQFGIVIDDAISEETDWVNRFIEFGLSDQALLEGMMGLVSGPIQYAVTTAPFQDFAGQKKNYINQRATIAKNKEFFDNKANIINNRTKAIEDAIQRNQAEVAELMQESSFDVLAIENFARGTTEHLETSIKELIEAQETTQEEKEALQGKLERLLELEQQYEANYSKYTNGEEVFNNRTKLQNFNKALQIVKNQQQTILDNVSQELNVVVDQYNRTKEGQANPISTSDIMNIIDNRLVEEWKALPKGIQDSVANSSNMQYYRVNREKNIPLLNDTIKELNDTYNDITKRSYQLGYERLKDVMSDYTTTEEKIEGLNELLKDTKNLGNKALTDRIKRHKAEFENNVAEAKKADAQANKEPETIKAEKKIKPSTVQQPETQVKSELSPEELQQVKTFREGMTLRFKSNGDTQLLNDLKNTTDEEILNIIKNKPEVLEDAQLALDEWANLSPEEKMAIKDGIASASQSDTKPQISPKQIQENEADTSPTIESLLGNEVSYQGRIFVVAKEGSKFILDSENLIIELEADPTSTANQLKIEVINKPEEVKKYKVSLLNENEVNVNGTTYLIRVNTNGNIIGLSPTNRPTQTIKNEALLIAVEIERNKTEFNTIVDDLVQNNQYEEIKDNYLELEFIQGVYGKNWNNTVANALEKLYNNKVLTSSEKLALDLWVTDALIELTKLYVNNPSLIYSEALDNLEIINILLYDGTDQITERQNTSKASTPQPSKKRTQKVTKPKESKLNKTEEVVTTQQPSSEQVTKEEPNLEQQKADIERRKQEELKEYNVMSSEIYYLYDLTIPLNDQESFLQQGVKQLGNSAKEKLSPKEYNQAQKLIRAWVESGLTIKEIGNKLDERFNVSGISADMKVLMAEAAFNKINAKYDAELAALETEPNLSEEDFQAIDDVFGEDPKTEIQENESPKSEEVEVRDFNAETNAITEQLQAEGGKALDSKAQVHVKAIVPNNQARQQPNNAKFVDWLENGVSKEGTVINFTTTNFDKKAFATFNKLKRGEEVSKEEEDYMYDNLAIRLNPDGQNDVSSFLYVVRPEKGTADGVRLERQLRKQIIDNLLQGLPAQSRVTGQYGGDLKVTDTDVSITDIPDFRNMNVDDIVLMYVNGEGNLFDVATRQLTANDNFTNQKILLKATGKPMAGAIFTIVRKANGEQFPLKLNVKPLSELEKQLVSTLLKNIITPSGKDQANVLNRPLSDAELALMDQADVDFLSSGGKTITHSMALNHLIYEGERSTSNPVTQLLFKNGKIIFGSKEITLDNFLQMEDELLEFLDKYKTRNVDLRKLNNDITYKRHVINNGLLTTNTDTATSKNTLFEALDLMQAFPNDSDRVTNRYKSASIYLEPNVINKAPDVKKTKVKEGVDFVFQENSELSNIGTPEQYSEYLDTIFPDSKVKDIVYHWSVGTQISEQFGDDLGRVKGIWISKNPNEWKELVQNKSKRLGINEIKRHILIINAQNVWVDSTLSSPDGKKFPKNYDTIASYEEAALTYSGELTPELKTLDEFEAVIKSKSQVFELGSKQDIEGFKKFVSKSSLEIKPEVSSIVTVNETAPINNVLADKLEQNKDNMQLPNTNIPVRQVSDADKAKQQNAMQKLLNKKKKNDDNTNCNQ